MRRSVLTQLGELGTGEPASCRCSIWQLEAMQYGERGRDRPRFFFAASKSGETNGRMRSYTYRVRGRMFFLFTCFSPLSPGFLPDGVTNVVYAQTESAEGEKPSFSLLLASSLSLSGSSIPMKTPLSLGSRDDSPQNKIIIFCVVNLQRAAGKRCIHSYCSRATSRPFFL